MENVAWVRICAENYLVLGLFTTAPTSSLSLETLLVERLYEDPALVKSLLEYLMELDSL